MPEDRLSHEVWQMLALVCGRVQGVYFRDFVQRHARALGLVGWVRNLPDGATVEVVAQGAHFALEHLLAHLGRGPEGAHVASVDVQWSIPDQEFTSFAIVR